MQEIHRNRSEGGEKEEVLPVNHHSKSQKYDWLHNLKWRCCYFRRKGFWLKSYQF